MGILEMFNKGKVEKKEKLSRGLNRRRELASLEDQEIQKFNRPLIKDMDVEIQKTYQSLPMMSEDPHVHSHGVISPMQGIHALVEDVLDLQNCDNLANQDCFLAADQAETLEKEN